MNFPSIDIQGSILSSDLFGKIRSEQANFQQGKDFNPAFTNAKLKDEISLAWQDAKGQWTIFQNKLKRVAEGETAATETRSFWILPLLANLGYDFQYFKSAEELNGKSFWINNRDNNIGGFPLFIAGYNESLDRRSENKTLRVSPHALVQEYLNCSENLYGLVTNGKLLRLLRDASRLTRLSYLEFNLEKIMEEGLYSDFVILYRLLHVSRMPQQQNGGAESIIEKFHQEGLEAGATIRSKLGDAVKESIKTLANGFVNHPDNAELRQVIVDGHFDPDEFYRQQLRIVYRLLFLFVIEERNLVYSESKDPDIRRFSRIYYNHFSLQRLRKLAKHLPPPEASRHYDLWLGLLNTFAMFENQHIGAKMGIMALQGDLFSYSAITSPAYDLHDCRLSNEILLRIIKSLGYFENDKQLLIAVNYGGLDVEEFGSVYEGLLELKLKIEPVPGSEFYSCSFDKSSERSSTGSHYTPEELVQPLIKHSLDYIIEDRLKVPAMGNAIRQPLEKQALQKKQLLAIRVCDISCGSGHILLSAARKIALALARVETGEEQPNPKAIRQAMREVIRYCIYGVDKNPLAVELCKVAFWLESYNPGEPLGFLDHHIKCGDAIVGLAHREELENGIADEAFKSLPGDEKELASTYLKKNRQERNIRKDKEAGVQFKTTEVIENTVQESMAEYHTFNLLPENTPEQITAKAMAYNKFINGKGQSFMKSMADLQVAQFFIPKTTANKNNIITDNDFMTILKGFGGWQNRQTGHAMVVAQGKRFFHWFLEFPEVFQNGGFDCVLGNPPFLGGKRISGNFGDDYLNFIKTNYEPSNGGLDFVVYFFRRVYEIILSKGFLSLISTNTISQGDSRVAGLEYIQNRKGTINHAIKSMPWPGKAAVEVSLVTITKQIWEGKFILGGRIAKVITSYLDEDENPNSPFQLKKNENKSFQGTVVLGTGFILTKNQVVNLIALEPKNRDVLFPYLNGDDLNNNIEQTPGRWIINFFDWNESVCLKKYPDIFEIVINRVKPERLKVKREKYKRLWWQFAERGVNLYSTIKELERVLVVAKTTKYGAYCFVPNNYVYTQDLTVFGYDKYDKFIVLNSSIMTEWTWKNSTTYGGSGIRLNPTLCFETYPFPEVDEYRMKIIEKIGQQYELCRQQLMLAMQLGLTKTNNAFHAKEIQTGITTDELSVLDKKAIEKQYGKEVWNLWNHLQKTRNPVNGGTSAKASACTFEEAVAGIIKLRELHVEMDNAVLEAYGWKLDSAQQPAVQLRHDFYEVDYLPENDRVRYTIHPDARKEILKRLLELNHKIHEEEVRKGLWDKKKTYAKAKGTKEVGEPEEGYGDLFNQENSK